MKNGQNPRVITLPGSTIPSTPLGYYLGGLQTLYHCYLPLSPQQVL